MNKIKLSGVVITFNEEEKIERCILSLMQVCDEIVVLDSYSTDHTCEIASELGAKIFRNPFEGHIQQKNLALTFVTSPYVLSLDADEELSKELIESIRQVKSNWKYDGYSMNRLNNYAGQWIKHGAWYPDKKIRLFDSRKGEWGGNNPHDRFIMSDGSAINHLHGNLLHYTMNSYDDLISQTDKFSSIAANSLSRKNFSISRLAIAGKTLFRFVKEYFFLLGFLDGKAGFNIAAMNARYVWLKYTKIKKTFLSK